MPDDLIPATEQMKAANPNAAFVRVSVASDKSVGHIFVYDKDMNVIEDHLLMEANADGD